MTSYRDSHWRCLPYTVPTQRIYLLFKSIQPSLALEYNAPEALNGLFCWTIYEEPWQVHAFALRHGIGHPFAAPLDIQQIAIALEKENWAVEHACSNDGVLGRLTEASRLLQTALQEVRLKNEFRMIGISPNIWVPLAEHGLFTLASLRAQGAEKLMQIPDIKDREVAEIAGCMYEFGWYLSN